MRLLWPLWPLWLLWQRPGRRIAAATGTAMTAISGRPTTATEGVRRGGDFSGALFPSRKPDSNCIPAYSRNLFQGDSASQIRSLPFSRHFHVRNPLQQWNKADCHKQGRPPNPLPPLPSMTSAKAATSTSRRHASDSGRRGPTLTSAGRPGRPGEVITWRHATRILL
jgi:hypothetical protein